MKDKTFYITTPIYYMSGKVQIGNAYPTVASDVMARYKKLRGFDVKFLTGTDDHGQKVERVAAQAGKTPQAYVDDMAEFSKTVWEALDCEYDIFMRTSAPFHVKAVQRIFKELFNRGDIYKGEYEGLYCVHCETFFGPKNEVCADCARPLDMVREECYFLKLSKYQEPLLRHIEQNPDFIRPAHRKNEMVSFLKGGLEDIAVTRTTVKWGVAVDFDPRHVVYVWIDALSNYATALGFMGDDDREYKKYWPADVHMVGKDILRFHTIYWPAMMMALGEPLPKTVYGTGWLLIDGGKMSKSKGNVVDPMELVKKYGSDAVRYFLMREIVMGQDGNYTEEALAGRINADLANDLGNLLSRTVGMIEKYFDGSVKKTEVHTAFDGDVIEILKLARIKAEEHMDAMDFSHALTEIWGVVRRANKYVDETEPWVLFRNKSMDELARVMYVLAEVLRHAAIMIGPVMPRTSKEIFRQLGIGDDDLKCWKSLEFGKLPGALKVQKGETLFPRIDLAAAFGEESAPAPAPVPDPKSDTNEITIDDFAKLDLRVGIIKECEKVGERLLKSQVDMGGETRQILSGIAQWYSPEDMVGKRVVVVANLKPIKLKGHLSQGMILAAGEGTPDDPVRVVSVDGDAPPGTNVR